MSSTFVQDPQAKLDYQWDWATDGWLAVGETISTFTVAAAPADLVIGNGTTGGPAPTQAAGKVTAWLSGGTAGTAYDVTCHIVTSAGRVDDRTLVLHIADQ